ncbi:MAG: thermostable hemolysin [Rhodospirillaceae bacterium]|nr:thermostable hemolysin [Rhodospirillaceae bacterium]
MGTDRSRTEELIRGRFRKSYGADLHTLMPRLFTMADGDGQLVCAFGLREAAKERLYMEQYLDQPVESVIAERACRSVDRSQVIEVGNLASMPGNARSLIVTLTRYLYNADFHWVVFTGVTALRAAFSRLGLQPMILAAAEPSRLEPADLAKWGDYFTAAPQVMAGDIRNGYRMLEATASSGPVSWR